MRVAQFPRIFVKSVSNLRERLRRLGSVRRISLLNLPTAFAGWIPNLLDQVGGGLENPHWRGERVILLPLSAFSYSSFLAHQSHTLVPISSVSERLLTDLRMRLASFDLPGASHETF